MSKRLDVFTYLRGPETTRPMELVYGVVREPPAPYYSHQAIVTRLTVLLDGHVREHELGRVCVSPIDVVLDIAHALVVQPDIVFISTARAEIVHDRIWGPPDLVIEVASPGTARRDRTVKLRWYRRYGVRECWLADPVSRSIEVIQLGQPRTRRRRFRFGAMIRSAVLPDLRLAVGRVFDA